MSKKELKEDEINQISARGDTKDFGYTSLGILALAGGVAALGHNIKSFIKYCKEGYGIEATSVAIYAASTVAAGLLTAGGAFALSKLSKNKNDSDNKN